MKVILTNNTVTKDITNLTGAKTWSGEKTKAPRTLNFDFLTIEGTDINLGDFIIFMDGDKELFRGMVLGRGANKNNVRSIRVYDSLYHWSNNKDTFTFKNITADNIFRDICNRFQITPGAIASTNYKILEQISPNMMLYDTMKQALSTTYQNTGIRYYMRDNKGKPELVKRANQVHQWVLEVGSNIIDFDYDESAEKLYSKVKLVSEDKNNTVIATAQNDNLIKKFGILQYFNKEDSKLNKAQLQVKANNLINELGKIERNLTLKTLGINDVISGDAVFVKIPFFGITKAFYVDGDTHTFDDGVHLMSLKLSETNEI